MKLFFSYVLGAPKDIGLASEFKIICFLDWGLFPEVLFSFTVKDISFLLSGVFSMPCFT